MLGKLFLQALKQQNNLEMILDKLQSLRVLLAYNLLRFSYCVEYHNHFLF